MENSQRNRSMFLAPFCTHSGDDGFAQRSHKFCARFSVVLFFELILIVSVGLPNSLP